MRTRWVLLAVLGLAVACSSDDSKGNHFKDTAGRSCTIDGKDISCTGEGAMCTAPSTPTFVAIGLMMSPMELCPGCHEADGNDSYETTGCTQIVCQSDSDCGFPAATCKSGLCWCASGQCP